jgi:hypothetical protein
MSGQRSTQRVFVHAWEHSPGDAGSGGFDWYWSPEALDRAYNKGIATRIKADPEDCADFRFTLDVPFSMDPGEITSLIDGDLQELCAHAHKRRVGANVLAYWQRAGMNMGDATHAAREE